MVNSPGCAIVLLSNLRNKAHSHIHKKFSGRLFVSLVNSHCSVMPLNLMHKEE